MNHAAAAAAAAVEDAGEICRLRLQSDVRFDLIGTNQSIVDIALGMEFGVRSVNGVVTT